MTVSGSESNPTDSRVTAVRRRTTGRRALGAGIGLAAAFLSMQVDSLGRGLLLAAPVFAICVLTGVLLGELAIRPQSMGQRSATLLVRQPRDYLPRGLTTAVAVETVALLVTLTGTTLAASPDDLGRAGRILSRTCGTTGGWSQGPWPGSYYSVPLVAILLAGMLASWATLHRVARRPRVVASPDAGTLDDALRRRAGEMIVAAFGVLVGVPFFAITVLVSSALIPDHMCAPTWWPVAGWLVLTLAGTAFVTLGWCTAVLVDGHNARRLPLIRGALKI